MEEVKPRNHEANGPRGQGRRQLLAQRKGERTRRRSKLCILPATPLPTWNRWAFPSSPCNNPGCENIKCIFSPEVESYRDKTYLSKEPSEFLFAELQLVLLAPESTVQVHWQVMVRAAAQHHRHSVHVLGSLNTQKCSCWSIPVSAALGPCNSHWGGAWPLRGAPGHPAWFTPWLFLSKDKDVVSLLDAWQQLLKTDQSGAY